MEWSDEFYEWKRGDGCPACAEGRPEETDDGLRFYAGATIDAYLRKPEIQPGLSVAVWRGRHVVEPTELDADEAVAFFGELLRVVRAIEAVFKPLKLNYNILGNSVPHLHVHLVPRYEDDPRPGWPFPFPEEEPPHMDGGQLAEQVAALRSQLV